MLRHHGIVLCDLCRQHWEKNDDGLAVQLWLMIQLKHKWKTRKKSIECEIIQTMDATLPSDACLITLVCPLYDVGFATIVKTC
jgi:hypothetical protein